MHAEMCPVCKDKLEELMLSQSTTVFESISSQINTADNFDMDFSSMIDSITSSDSVYIEKPVIPKSVNVRGHEYIIPRAIDKVAQSNWQNLGKLSRARLDLNEGGVHTSLLHIDPSGTVPAHTHKGFELTLLLDGSFEDELGAYTKGDFIWLTKSHTHKPETKDGCLCYTVSSNALQFTKGLARILNPIGNFIY
jgi:putative transcriptional regulator